MLGSLGIDLDPIAGEAHWQLGIAEVSIKLVKGTLDTLARAHPTRPVQEMLSRSLAALNAQELVRGYSHLQHALGGAGQRDGEFQPEDSPVIADVPEHEHSRELRRDAEVAAIEALYTDRERRAMRTRSRKLQTFQPGQLVCYWRKGKGKKPNPSMR